MEDDVPMQSKAAVAAWGTGSADVNVREFRMVDRGLNVYRGGSYWRTDLRLKGEV